MTFDPVEYGKWLAKYERRQMRWLAVFCSIPIFINLFVSFVFLSGCGGGTDATVGGMIAVGLISYVGIFNGR